MIDINRLVATKVKLREAEIPAPELDGLDGIPDGEHPCWKVRMLTGPELDQANESGQRGEIMMALARKMGGTSKSQADAMMEALGIADGNTPEETRKAYDFLVAGTIEPELTRPQAIWLYKYYPIFAKNVVRKILELTGLGADMGKSSPSGETRKSETTSLSVN